MAKHSWPTTGTQEQDPDLPLPLPGARRWRIGLGATVILCGILLAWAAVFVIRQTFLMPQATMIDISPAAGASASPRPGAVKASGTAGPRPTGATDATGGTGSGDRGPDGTGTGGTGSGSTGSGSTGSGGTGTGGTGPAGSGSSAPASVLVHVTGAVARPGVVDLPAGSRVFDAVQKAGGATAAARLGSINLAAVVVDGSQLLVPSKDDPDPVPAAQPGAPAGTVPAAPGAGPPGPLKPGAKVNLNTASAAELQRLPRVGPVLAERIIAWRTDHGPFTKPEDLDAVPGIGPAMLAALVELVSV